MKILIATLLCLSALHVGAVERAIAKEVVPPGMTGADEMRYMALPMPTSTAPGVACWAT